MFFFGDNSVAVDHYFSLGRELAGARMLDVHYDEMDENQLRRALTCLSYSLKQAEADGASEQLIEVLEEPYKEVFTLLCQQSFQFRRFVMSGSRVERSPEYFQIALSAN